MSMISLHKASRPEVTVLSNYFIDNFMGQANGEFVKVYIYLLRTAVDPFASFSLERMADRLLCTERDIFRALKYWEKEQLLTLAFTENGRISGITLTEPEDIRNESAASQAAPSGIYSPGGSFSQDAVSVPDTPVSSQDITASSSFQKLTRDRVATLKQNEEIRQLLFITEKYLGKTLTPTEMQKILFFYDELKMSAELIEYLVEYCVSRGRRSIRYIETVALAWNKDGITTVEMAKEHSSRFTREYYTILKAMGISGRNPVEEEIAFMDTWHKTYGFDLAIIQEACSRTVLSTGQPSFQYADKILSGWKDKNVHTLDDIRALDARHKQRQLEKAAARKDRKQAPKPQTPNRFNNFHQRDYDFDEYEKRLLNQ